MKKKIALATLVLCFSVSTSAFAAQVKNTDSKTISGYTLTASLDVSNPIYSSPYAKAKTEATVQSYSLKATVKVTNSDGTTNSKASSASNAFTTGWTGAQYADDYWSSGTHFDGGHEASDSKYGYWYGSTYHYY